MLQNLGTMAPAAANVRADPTVLAETAVEPLLSSLVATTGCHLPRLLLRQTANALQVRHLPPCYDVP